MGWRLHAGMTEPFFFGCNDMREELTPASRAGSGAERGIIDVLTITRAGRLAILELKASEQSIFPCRPRDYWLRVRRHLELGEFRSYGYFPGVEIHSVTGILLDALSPQNRSGSGGLDGKLAARHPGGDAPIATTTRH